MNLREIDRLVAKKVMGWRLKSFAGGGGGFVAWVDDDGKIVKYENDCTLHAHPINFWKPTTNITDAWKVVEKLIDEGYDINVYNHNKEFNVEINIEEDDKHLWFYGEADSAPLAICLAALKVVGVEVEGEPK